MIFHCARFGFWLPSIFSLSSFSLFFSNWTLFCWIFVVAHFPPHMKCVWVCTLFLLLFSFSWVFRILCGFSYSMNGWLHCYGQSLLSTHDTFSGKKRLFRKQTNRMKRSPNIHRIGVIKFPCKLSTNRRMTNTTYWIECKFKKKQQQHLANTVSYFKYWNESNIQNTWNCLDTLKLHCNRYSTFILMLSPISLGKHFICKWKMFGPTSKRKLDKYTEKKWAVYNSTDSELIWIFHFNWFDLNELTDWG